MSRRLKHIILFPFLLGALTNYTAAQGSKVSRLTMIQKTCTEIITDANLNEPVWQTAVVADSMINKRVAVYCTARLQSEIRIMYNEQYMQSRVNTFATVKEARMQSLRQASGNFDADLIHPVIGRPNVEFTFSNTLSWTTFWQYDAFLKNYNVNSRLQWRIKPLSDFYLTYTDNYFESGLPTIDRYFVIKIGYWIN